MHIWETAIRAIEAEILSARHDPDIATAQIDSARQWGLEFISKFEAEMPELNQYILNTWMYSAIGQEALTSLAKAAARLTKEVPIGDPGHDLRHTAKDLVATLRIIKDETMDWRILFLFPALLHDIGRRAEAIPKTGINKGDDHAFTGAVFARDLFGCFELPKELVAHWLYAILRHQSGTPDGSGPWMLEATTTADRLQVIGVEKFLRALACDVGVIGIPLTTPADERWSRELVPPGHPEESCEIHLEFYLRNLHTCVGFGARIAEELKKETLALLTLLLRPRIKEWAFRPELMRDHGELDETMLGRFKKPIPIMIWEAGRELADLLLLAQVGQTRRKLPTLIRRLLLAKSAVAPEEVIARVTERITELTVLEQDRWEATINAALLLMSRHDRKDKELAQAIMVKYSQDHYLGIFAKLVDDLL